MTVTESKADQLVPQLLQKLRLEALDISLETREYCLSQAKELQGRLDPQANLALNCFIMGITARQAESIAWILARLAHYENNCDASSEIGFPALDLNLELVQTGHLELGEFSENLPKPYLESLLRLNDESLALYKRILRLENMAGQAET